MTDQFMKDEELRKAYGISGDEATWDSTFSTVSVENLLLYIVSTGIYALEVLFDNFRADVDVQVSRNIVPTVRWYHSRASEFQIGDSLAYDDANGQFRYPEENPDKQIVKYAAVRDRGGSIQILVAKDSSGSPSILTETELNAFTSYMNQVKVAGVVLDIRSIPSDRIRVYAEVQVDPQVIDLDGVRLSDGAKVVEDAVDAYLRGIVYGGTFNKTKCVDAIQNVEGVLDVTLSMVQVRPDASDEWTTVSSNNYMSASGSFRSEELENSISYVL